LLRAGPKTPCIGYIVRLTGPSPVAANHSQCTTALDHVRNSTQSQQSDITRPHPVLKDKSGQQRGVRSMRSAEGARGSSWLRAAWAAAAAGVSCIVCVCVCVCVCDSVCVAGGAHIARGTSLPIFPHFRNSGTTIDPNSPPTGGYGDAIGG
jgi:hypothetical protein